MNGQSLQPPNKGYKGITNETPHQNDESALNGIEMKQEHEVKLYSEDEDDMVTVPTSERAASGSVVNSIGGDRTGASYDFTDVCELDEIKSELKKEKMNKEARKGSSECSKNESIGSPTPNDPKNIRSNKNHNPSKPKRGSIRSKLAMKSVDKARNIPKAGVRSTKKKSKASKRTSKQHKCSSCDYTTSNKCDLIKHIRKHTGEKPFPCNHCAKRFTHKHHLQSHMRSHVSEFLFSCSNCLKGFDQNDEKVEHENSCKARRFECHLCKEYSTFQKINLEYHMLVHHTGERPFGCDLCSKKFKKQIDLKRHQKTHINPRPLKIKCSVCYRNFSQRIEKDEHESKCKRRGYECYLCKEFTNNSVCFLKQHMRTHTGLKPFQCKMCQKSFSQKSNLKRHENRSHK